MTKLEKTRRATENKIANHFGYTSSVLFGRARAALTALLETIGNNIDTPFILPSNICPSVIASGAAARTTIVPVPVERSTGLPNDDAFCRAMDGFGAFGIVMPTHLYGFRGEYKRTAKFARDKGWFILENDTSAVTVRTSKQSKKLAFGDALLVSFGPGKVIDGSAGGALVTDDKILVKALQEHVSHYPLLDKAAETTEDQLMIVRRLLRKSPKECLNMMGLYENFLAYETSGARVALPEKFDTQILAALGRVEKERETRIKQVQEWRRVLVEAGSPVHFSPLDQPSPWRLTFRIEEYRNEIVASLRSDGTEVGTNYPPVQEFFPRLLGSKIDDSSRQWGHEVINLFLTSDYGVERKKKIAAKLTSISKTHT